VFLLPRRKNKTFIHDKREFASRLKCLLGFRPKKLRLYETAFIHRSASYTLPDGTRINNERLEYLGDAILDSIISEYLFHIYPDATEGFMTKARAKIVNRDILNNLAISMDFDKLIVSNVSSTGSSRNLYGNAFEALLGALFIDRGYDRTRLFLLKRVVNKHLFIEDLVEIVTDYKSILLEYCQKEKHSVNFTFSDEIDPVTLKTIFTVYLKINDELYSTGRGNTKKEAEQDAALKSWTTLNPAP